MKNLLMRINGIVYKAFGMTWIVSPIGETCSPVPVYYVVEGDDEQ